MSRFSRLFPQSAWRGVGCAAGAAGILAVVLSGVGKLTGVLDVLILLMGIGAAGCLGYMGLLRLQGKKPAAGLPGMLTVFFMLFTVGQCRSWGSESQLQEYFFPFLGCVFLMLYSYYLTMASVRRGSRRWLVFLGQGALFCCVLSLNGGDWPFCLGIAVWLTLDLCSVSCKHGTAAHPPEEAV